MHSCLQIPATNFYHCAYILKTLLSTDTMAASSKPTIIYDLKDEDFFEKFDLKKVQFLEEGSAGKVFLVASKSKPGPKRGAVKVFPLQEEDYRYKLKLFQTEVAVMTAISHPHLVPCLIAARCHSYAALLMPYYAKGDLVENASGKMEPRRVQRYMSHVARAVEHLHRHNIVHNDIKLENVFLDGSDRAYLGDFGLALVVKGASRTAPAEDVGGTRVYWPPEKVKAADDDRLDPFKSDVYAIGVMYWALVSGEDFDEDTDFLGRLRNDTDFNLTPSERSCLEKLLEPDPSLRPTASQAMKMLK